MTTQPDVYDVACLAGGAPRVVDTALVALVVTGRVRAVVPGELQVVEPQRRHPVEAAVLDAVGGRNSVEAVRRRAEADERITGMVRRLRRERLLRRFLGPTAAGRRVLDRARAADVGPVLHVALEGREQLSDPALRAAVLEPARRPAGVPPWGPSSPHGGPAGRRTRDTLLAGSTRRLPGS